MVASCPRWFSPTLAWGPDPLSRPVWRPARAVRTVLAAEMAVQAECSGPEALRRGFEGAASAARAAEASASPRALRWPTGRLPPPPCHLRTANRENPPWDLTLRARGPRRPPLTAAPSASGRGPAAGGADHETLVPCRT